MSQVSPELAAGLQLHRSGRFSEAERIYVQVLESRPNDADVLCLLGSVRLSLGNYANAVADLRAALHFRPNYPEAHNNLGIGLSELGRLGEAEASFRSALALRPGYAEAHNNLGTVLRDRSKLDEAEACFREAVRIKPSYAEAQMNLGVALAERGMFNDAIACYEQAIRLHPGYAAAHMNLGNARRDRGELELAEASYQAALNLLPEYAEAHFNRALSRLLQGDFETGWQGYEWRSRCRAFPQRPFVQPTWDGAPLAGRTILLHTEQGLGDSLQFIRYARLVKDRGGYVVVECPGVLRELLGRCPGIDQVVARGESLPWFDVQAPLMSLPRILKTSLATIPAPGPYLVPDPARVARWRAELAGVAGFKVGICWQGNPKHPADRQRSFPLEQLAPLANLPGVRLFSLQKGHGREQIEATGGRLELTDLGPRLDEAGGAFVDTAAVLPTLDLVIAPNTAIAHLAGAIGVPVWVALPDSHEWRWLIGREDSPWYPTMRLFRRGANAGWNEVFERMAGELRGKLASRGRPISVEISPGELIDRITILELKAQSITDPGKLASVRHQLAALTSIADRELDTRSEVAELAAELKSVNHTIWQAEDELRVCERSGDFGPRFIELARSIYRNNDRRAALKQTIDARLGSALSEVKSYAIDSDNLPHPASDPR